MKIFETHAHYDDESFDNDRERLITEMLGDSGIIDVIVNIGTSLKGCKDSLTLAAKYDKMYAAIGIHPSDVEALTAKDIEWLGENAVNNPKVVAIGEIGLDYHYEKLSKDIQKKWFIEQIALAKKVKKPIIVHSRDACQDTINIMKQEDAKSVGGIVHCYAYTKETAKDFLKNWHYRPPMIPTNQTHDMFFYEQYSPSGNLGAFYEDSIKINNNTGEKIDTGDIHDYTPVYCKVIK